MRDTRDAANVALPADVVSAMDTTPIVEVTAGRDHTCARRASGTAVCWGRGWPGDGCDGQCPLRLAPTRGVRDLVDATRLTAGSYHTCALRMTGEIDCWGDNLDAQLGNRTVGSRSALPVPVTGLANAMFVAAGDAYSCAIRAPGAMPEPLLDHRARCWTNSIDGAERGAHSQRRFRRSNGEIAVLSLDHAAAFASAAARCSSVSASGYKS
jgi:alpha-tubulin suppressor-like RCC1 family protein